MEEIDLIRIIANKHFVFSEIEATKNGYEIEIEGFLSPFSEIKRDFEAVGFYPFLRKVRFAKKCFLARKRYLSTTEEKITINIILFILTLLTTTWAGYNNAYFLYKSGYIKNPLYGALSYSIGIMLILGCHELGHKFAAMKNDVRATWPYFLPVPAEPFLFGTMGAVIKMKSPVTNRNASVEIGAAGPLFGVVIGIPLLILGLKMSFNVPVHLISSQNTHGIQIYIGESIIIKFLKMLFVEEAPAGYELMLHPLAFAGWAGLLVTSLNLIPVGQLDGGHIVRALMGGKFYKIFQYAIIAILAVMGIYWSGWFVWAFIGLFLSSLPYPGVMNEFEDISLKNKIIAIVSIIVFILCFIPTPVIIK